MTEESLTLEKLQIHNRLSEIEQSLSSLQGWLNSEFGWGSDGEGNQTRNRRELRENVKEIIDLLKLQNGRVRKLENWRNVIIGGMVVIGGLLTYITPSIARLILK